MTTYLKISKDESLTESVSTEKLKDFISSMPEFIKKSEFGFKNSKLFPHSDITLLKAKSISSWSSCDYCSINTNLISIVCSENNDFTLEKMEVIFKKIARFLNWELVYE